jgi:NAD(P)-dependent dehydrogenase (short-subunit alcohol dehydrogenase family)
LVRDGWKIVLTDMDEDELHRVASGFGRHQIAGTYVLDVTDFDAVHFVVAEAAKTNGGLHGLVTAAGGLHRIVGPNTPPFIDSAPGTWDRIIEVHLSAVYYTCHAILPVLYSGAGGAIVNIASGAGLPGGPPHLRQRHAAVYSAAKAGVIALTQSLAQEAAPRGVRANCVAPGRTESRTKSWEQLEHLQREEDARHPGRTSPLGRFGHASEMGEAVAFLLSERASYITGACLDVTGGMRLR